ncbi:bicyclomycin resistance protein [Anaplasma centrale str. Israel]|uniref:Bicyclomycin resistance protein n=1 Tax=Anaplasma centrale (strain Israel) TaxID=574556 RepID=D1ASX1_ANACI|nr:MFS transporter [Anaplasma centrale]ACZ49574.1 bicyclomycin resistance protein [Anaplasma centrale str. Israel]
MLLSSLAFILAVLSVVLVDITNAMYANYLTQVGAFFGAEQTVTQFTVSCEMLGYSTSGLIYGPMSDRHGRRPVMLFGMAVFLITGLWCYFANSITVLIIARFFCGVGAGVSAVVGYAIICDTYSSEECSKRISLMYMCAVTGSAFIAPGMSSYMIEHGYGWRTVFVVSIVLSAALLSWLVCKLPETISERRAGCNPITIVSGYVALLRNRRFLAYCFIKVLTMTYTLASVGTLPFVFIEGMGLQAKYYGYVAAIGGVSFIAGTMANVKLVGRFGMRRMIAVGLVLTVASDVAAIMADYYFALTPVLVEAIWIPSSFCISLIASNGAVLAFREVSNKGAASAFIIFCQTVFGVVGMYVVGKFYNGTIVPICLLTFTCCGISSVILCVCTPRSEA